MFQYPDIDPVAFQIWRLSVHWYGLTYVLGFFLGWLGVRARSRRADSPIAPERVEDFIFYLAIGVFVGGRVGYMLIYDFPRLLDDPLSLLYVWRGGMSFHGGLIGVLLMMALFAKRTGQTFFAITDCLAPWVPPALFAVRVGNFINGELWGAETSADMPLSVVFEGVPRHPTQLYEAFLEGIVLFVVLQLYALKTRPRMAVSGLFLLLYGVFRFGVEFIRLPDAHIGYEALGWVTRGQILTTPMIVAGIVLLVLAYRRKA